MSKISHSKIGPITYRSIQEPLFANNGTGSVPSIVRAAIRITQVVLAIAIAGIYGADLHNHTSNNQHAPAAWIYAEIVAVISVLTCVFHYFVHIPWIWAALWDFVICILWTAQTGFFGTVFLGSKEIEEEYMSSNEEMMKAGVGIGLACMLLWLASFVQGIVFCCQTRRVRKVNKRGVDRTIETVMEHGRCTGGSQAHDSEAVENVPDYEDVVEKDEKKV